MTGGLPLFEVADSPNKATPAKTYADKKRTEVLIEKAADDDILVREWRQWRAGEVREAFAGPHGAEVAELIATLKAATTWDTIDAAALLAPWQNADRDIRALARRAVNAFIVRLREDAKLPPFSDEIPSFEGGRL